MDPMLTSSPTSSGAVTGGIRPQSAMQRRPSISLNLDVIPEHRIMSQRVYDKNVEIELEAHDISTITASSYDPRQPPSISILSIGGRPNTAKSSWYSTGMLPQVLIFTFSNHWGFRKIELECSGVECISIYIGSNNDRVFQQTGKRMQKLSNTFSYDVRSSNHDELSTVKSKSDAQSVEGECNSAWGNQITFKFEEATESFVGVLSANMVAVPRM